MRRRVFLRKVTKFFPLRIIINHFYILTSFYFYRRPKLSENQRLTHSSFKLISYTRYIFWVFLDLDHRYVGRILFSLQLPLFSMLKRRMMLAPGSSELFDFSVKNDTNYFIYKIGCLWTKYNSYVNNILFSCLLYMDYLKINTISIMIVRRLCHLIPHRNQYI